jgi:hypothetical protein
MHFSQPFHELLVCLEFSVALDLRVQAINLADMARRVLVPCGTTLIERDILGPQRRGQAIRSGRRRFL